MADVGPGRSHQTISANSSADQQHTSAANHSNTNVAQCADKTRLSRITLLHTRYFSSRIDDAIIQGGAVSGCFSDLRLPDEFPSHVITHVTCYTVSPWIRLKLSAHLTKEPAVLCCSFYQVLSGMDFKELSESTESQPVQFCTSLMTHFLYSVKLPETLHTMSGDTAMLQKLKPSQHPVRLNIPRLLWTLDKSKKEIEEKPPQIHHHQAASQLQVTSCVCNWDSIV